MRILVFGGRGFVGRHLVGELVALGHDLYTVDNLRVRPAGELDPSWLKGSLSGDVSDYEVLSDALSMANPEAIYWFPAIQGYTAPRRLFCQVNVQAPWLLMDALDGWRDYRTLKRIVLASSEAQYSGGEDVLEHHEKDPDSDYGMSKKFQEDVFFHLGRTFKIAVVALRYSVVLGPGQSLDESQCGILRNWYHNRSRGLFAEVYGDGTHRRGFVHIDDVTRANLLALSCEIPGDGPAQFGLNIVGDNATVIEMAELWREVTGVDYVILNQDQRPGGEFSLWMNGRKAFDVLGYEPKKSCRDMIQDFVNSVDKTT